MWRKPTGKCKNLCMPNGSEWLKPWAGQFTSGLKFHKGLTGNKVKWCRNMQKLCLHNCKLTHNCSINWQQPKAIPAPLLLVILIAMSLRTFRLAGDQSPSISTAKGVKTKHCLFMMSILPYLTPRCSSTS